MDYTIDKPLSLKIRRALKNRQFNVPYNKSSWYQVKMAGDIKVRFVNVDECKYGYYRYIKVDVIVPLQDEKAPSPRCVRYVNKDIRRFINNNTNLALTLTGYLCHFGVKRPFVQVNSIKYIRNEVKPQD